MDMDTSSVKLRNNNNIKENKTWLNNVVADSNAVKKLITSQSNKIEYVDYKDTELLSRFVSERGKILPRRVTGTSD